MMYWRGRAPAVKGTYFFCVTRISYRLAAHAFPLSSLATFLTSATMGCFTGGYVVVKPSKCRPLMDSVDRTEIRSCVTRIHGANMGYVT